MGGILLLVFLVVFYCGGGIFGVLGAILKFILEVWDEICSHLNK